MIFGDKFIAGILVVRPLDKRIDASASANFEGHIVESINEGNNRLVLDMSEVDFIDSSGLVAIVSILRRIGPNGDLVICGMKETVLNLFRLTRMNRVFRIFPSAKEAVDVLSCRTASG
jgi:anti-sigma B factor antagonist